MMTSQLAQANKLLRLYISQGSSTTTTSCYTGTTAGWVNLPTGTATTVSTPLFHGIVDDDGDPQWRGGHYVDPNTITVRDGVERTINLPDGTVISVTKDGSFTISDKEAKVIYRANRVRDFNTFLNASDKLEAFIKFCGTLGVRQDEMLNIPVKHFIAWLIVESARADNEPEPDILLLADLRKQAKPHCASCGRFISPRLKARKIEFCAAACFDRGLAMARAA